MTAQLQVRTDALGDVAVAAAHRILEWRCVPPIGEHYVDRADVVAGQASWHQGAEGPEVRLPTDVYLVDRAELIEAANTTPPGAKRPAGRIALTASLGVSGATVVVRAGDPDLGVLEAMEDRETVRLLKDAIRSHIGTAARLDLRPLLGLLRLQPDDGRVDLIGDVIAVRFDAVGEPTPRILPGQEWALVLDGPAVEQLVAGLVPQQLGAPVTSFQVTPQWRPHGEAPTVDLAVSGKVEVPDPFTASFSGTLSCQLTLLPGYPAMGNPARLQARVEWDIKENLGAVGHVLLAGPVALAARSFARQAIRKAMDPRRFRGQPAGDKAFTVEIELPQVRTPEATFHFDELAADDRGMIIGGRLGRRDIRLPTPATIGGIRPFRVEGTSHGEVLAFCGDPAIESYTAPVGMHARAHASADLRTGGAFCGFEVLGPGSSALRPYVHVTPGGVAHHPGDWNLRIRMPGSAVNRLNRARVRLILRMSRGTRCLDFGQAPYVRPVDESGETGEEVTLINVCYLDPIETLDGLPGELDPLHDPDELLIIPADLLEELGVRHPNLDDFGPILAAYMEEAASLSQHLEAMPELVAELETDIAAKVSRADTAVDEWEELMVGDPDPDMLVFEPQRLMVEGGGASRLFVERFVGLSEAVVRFNDHLAAEPDLAHADVMEQLRHDAEVVATHLDLLDQLKATRLGL